MGGLAYLLWLAVDTLRAPASAKAVAEEAAPARLILRGMVTNLLNPKAAIFYLALLPTFTNPQHGRLVLQALTLGLIHLTVSALIHSGLVTAAGSARTRVRRLDGSRGLRTALAIGLAGVAAWVAWTTRPG